MRQHNKVTKHTTPPLGEVRRGLNGHTTPSLGEVRRGLNGHTTPSPRGGQEGAASKSLFLPREGWGGAASKSLFLPSGRLGGGCYLSSPRGGREGAVNLFALKRVKIPPRFLFFTHLRYICTQIFSSNKLLLPLTDKTLTSKALKT